MNVGIFGHANLNIDHSTKPKLPLFVVNNKRLKFYRTYTTNMF